MIALVGAFRFFHLPQERIHLGKRQLAVRAECGVTGHGGEQFVALRFDQCGFAVARKIVEHRNQKRLKLGAAGYLVVYDPLVELYHYESISRGTDEDRAGKTRSLREKAVLLTRWPEPYVCDPYYSPSPRQGDPECAYYAF